MNFTKEKLKKVVFILFTLITFVFNSNFINAEENSKAKENTKEVLEFDKYVKTIDEYVENSGIEQVDFNQIASDLINNKGINDNLIKVLLKVFFKEIVFSIKSATIIYIIIIIMAIITSFDVEQNSDISKIAKTVCFIALASITIKNFLDIISSFKTTVNVLTTTMQVISPFLLAVLMSTGALSTTGLIQPILLFISSLIGFLINYIVIPFFMISVAFNIIFSVSENLRIDKVSKLFSGAAIWCTGILFTLFLGVLSLEGTISSSVDSIAVKTTQAAVSNFIPVVGKLFSDSFESVVGATKLIGKTGGIIGIIAIILISITPIIKIASILIIYNILNTLIEPIYSDEKISKYIDNFANVYKNLLGILIGIIILFIISTGIILNLMGSVVR